MWGFTASTLISVDGLVVPIILAGGSIAGGIIIPIILANGEAVGELVEPIIIFSGFVTSIVSIEILYDDTIVFTTKASSDGMVIYLPHGNPFRHAAASI